MVLIPKILLTSLPRAGRRVNGSLRTPGELSTPLTAGKDRQRSAGSEAAS